MSNALAERLAPVQDALAELERELREAARADNAPETWAAWSDLQAALMAVRAAQGRDARAAGYTPSRYLMDAADLMDGPPASCDGACCGQRAAASDTALACTPESCHNERKGATS